MATLRKDGRYCVSSKVDGKRIYGYGATPLEAEQNLDFKLHGKLHEAKLKKLDVKNLRSIWRGMKARCSRETGKSSAHYFQRGITVCDEWLEFQAFALWSVGNGYKDGLSLDRINPDGNYDPSNCRWIPLALQYATTRKAKQMMRVAAIHALEQLKSEIEGRIERIKTDPNWSPSMDDLYT